MSEAKKTCFIITPIGKPTDPIRRHIDGVVQGIKDAIGGEFDVIVAHEMFDIGSINRQVLEQIYTSDLVIANLTNLNPNVMYELAFRHSVGKPAIVIAEVGTVLPFDVKDERAFEYINDYMGLKSLGKTLCACIAKIDFGDETPRSPIHAMVQGFLLEQQVMSTAKGDEMKEILQMLLQKFESLENYSTKSPTTVDSQLGKNYMPNEKYRNMFGVELNGYGCERVDLYLAQLEVAFKKIREDKRSLERKLADIS